MPEIFGDYSERRAEEEGLDASEPKEDLDYIEGRKKLDFRHQFSSGETFEATEDDDGAKFIILKDGKGVFDFRDLVSSSRRFVTPQYLRRLSEASGSEEKTPYDFKINPEGYIKKVQGKWVINENFISIGEINSPKNIFALLHEIGHARTLQKYEPKMREVESENDIKKILTVASGAERAAWAEAIKIARKIKTNTGVDLFEAFSDSDDLKKYIYTNLSKQRYGAEVALTNVPKILLDIFRINPKSKKSEFLDGLFDKRKLVNK